MDVRRCTGFVFALVVAVTATLAGEGARAEPGGVIARDGDRITAEFSSADDTDAYAVDLAENAELGVAVKLGSAGFPTIRVRSADDDVRCFESRQGRTVRLRRFVAPSTGTWRVVVDAGVATDYTVSFSVKQPAGASERFLRVPADDFADVAFAAAPGATVGATITERFSDAVAGAAVLGPSGAKEAGGGFLTRKRRKLTLAPLVVGSPFGTYALRIEGGATSAFVDVDVRVKFAKVPKRVFTLATEASIGEAPPAPPLAIRQGTPALRVSFTGSNLPAGGQVVVGGDGVAVSSVETTPDRLEFTSAVADDAPYGIRDIVYCPPPLVGEPVRVAGALRVVAPTPTIASISPAAVTQGTTGTVVTLTGTGFRAGGAVSFGAGVTVTASNFVSPTTFTATVDAHLFDAVPGPHDVTYTQPTAGGGASVTLEDGLQVDAPAPTVAAVSPNVVRQGDSAVTLTVTGTNFRDGGTISVSGSGFAVLGSTTVDSATQASASVAVDADAAIGPRSVTFTQPAIGGGAQGTGTDLLTVHFPQPTIASVSPPTVTQGTSGVDLTLTGTNFRDDATVDLGANISVNTRTRLSDTSFRVNVDVGEFAAPGPRDVVYAQPAAGGGAAATLTGGLQVNAPTPTVTLVSPGVVRQGDAAVVLTVTGTNFRDGGSLSVSGTLVAPGATSVVSPTQATVAVAVDAAAAVGTRDVTFTQAAIAGAAAGTAVGALTVNHPDPTVSFVSPAAFLQGDSGTMTLTGTGFRAGGAVATSGSGVTFSNPQFVSATSFTVDYAAASAAPVGPRSVTYTQPAAGGGASVTLTPAYQVNPGPPTLASVTPSLWRPGDVNVSVGLVGTNFDAGTAVSVSGTGVVVNSATFVSATEMALDVTIASNASLGSRNLTISPAGAPQATFAGPVSVVPADLAVLAFSHVALAQGAAGVAVSIDGENFRSGDTLSVSGSGVTFGTLTFTGTSRISTTATVAAGAATGARNLTVTHSAADGGRSSTLTAAFRVTGATPTVTAANPSSISRPTGDVLSVPVTVLGTNFMSGATLAVTTSGGSGITVGSPVVVSDTTLSAVLTVTSSATLGAWNLVVTNPGGLGNSGTSGNGRLGVVGPFGIALYSVTPGTGGAFGGERVELVGANLSGATVTFGGVSGLRKMDAGLDVLSVEVPRPSTVSSTGLTPVDVTVTNGTGSATLTGAWTYGLDDPSVGFRVLATWPAQGATGLPQNLKTVAVRLSAPCDTTSGPHGSNSGQHSFWQVQGGSVVSSARSFAAGDRWLLLSRSSGSSLAAGTYVTNVPTALNSLGGNDLDPVQGGATADQYTFSISSGTDTTPPVLSAISPSNGTQGTDVLGSYVLTFNEAIDPATLGAISGLAVASISDDLRQVTVRHTSALPYSTDYSVTIGSGLTDVCGNAFSATTLNFRSQGNPGADNNPHLTATFEGVPDSMTSFHFAAQGSVQFFDLFAPRNGFLLDLAWSDRDDGIDTSTFSATSNVAIGSFDAADELASQFTKSQFGARWRVPAGVSVAASEDVTLSFLVYGRGFDQASDGMQLDVIDRNTTCTGSAANGHAGGDHDPFDARQTIVLRTDLDRYTTTFSTQASPALQGATTTASSDGTADFDDCLRFVGLRSANMTTAAAATVNGISRGTNAIVRRLAIERLRQLLRARWRLAQNGTRDADSVDIEFLLPGEQGSLAGLPTYSASDAATSSNAYSEISIGGTSGAEANAFTASSTYGAGWFDARNLRQETNLNTGSGTHGVFLLGLLKANLNVEPLLTRVAKKLVTVHGGTPVGESSHDDDVLAGSFSRTAAGNTAAQNARYDAILDAIEAFAMLASAQCAHEIAHSVGLVPDGKPKTGLFGAAYFGNSFTEATAANPNTSGHMNYVGNDLMSPTASVTAWLATGASFATFNPVEIAYLRNRLLYDEGR